MKTDKFHIGQYVKCIKLAGSDKASQYHTPLGEVYRIVDIRYEHIVLEGRGNWGFAVERFEIVNKFNNIKIV